MRADDIKAIKELPDNKRLFISYPKSGRTWVRFALASKHIDITFTHAGAATNRRQIGRPYDAIPAALQNKPLIFLHRNPIDTAVSMFYQVNHKDLRPWSGRYLRLAPRLILGPGLPPRQIDAFVRHPIWGVEKVCRYNRLWLEHLTGRTDCLVLTYETLRADAPAGFQTILDFLDITDVTGQELATASDFKRMRQIESQMGDLTIADGQGSVPIVGATGPKATPATFKVRKGRVRGYLDEISPETAQYCQQIAQRYGFDA